MFAFAFIVCAIVGGLKNRKTGHVKVEKNKHFVWAAIVATILVGASLVFSIFQPFADTMIYLARYGSYSADELVKMNIGDFLIGNFLLIVVLFIYLGITFGPIVMQSIIEKHGARFRKIFNRLFG